MQQIQLPESFTDDRSIAKQVQKLNQILASLESFDLAPSTRAQLETIINQVQNQPEKLTPKAYKKLLSSTQSKIKSLVKAEEGFIFSGDVQGTWLALGMSFGLLISMIGDFLMFIGMGIGLLFGILVGKSQEEQARKKGKLIQLPKERTDA